MLPEKKEIGRYVNSWWKMEPIQSIQYSVENYHLLYHPDSFLYHLARMETSQIYMIAIRT
jgi:hypothetical protein